MVPTISPIDQLPLLSGGESRLRGDTTEIGLERRSPARAASEIVDANAPFATAGVGGDRIVLGLVGIIVKDKRARASDVWQGRIGYQSDGRCVRVHALVRVGRRSYDFEAQKRAYS